MAARPWMPAGLCAPALRSSPCQHHLSRLPAGKDPPAKSLLEVEAGGVPAAAPAARCPAAICAASGGGAARPRGASPGPAAGPRPAAVPPRSVQPALPAFPPGKGRSARGNPPRGTLRLQRPEEPLARPLPPAAAVASWCLLPFCWFSPHLFSG